MDANFNVFKRLKAGQITANGTSEVTLTVPKLELDSAVFIVENTIAGTPAPVYISTKTPGSPGTLGFKSSASNTSVYDIFVIV